MQRETKCFIGCMIIVLIIIATAIYNKQKENKDFWNTMPHPKEKYEPPNIIERTVP